jgi:hypothetical protein
VERRGRPTMRCSGRSRRKRRSFAAERSVGRTTGPKERRPREPRFPGPSESSLPEVVVTLATLVATGSEAAVLETAVPNRRGRGHSCQAFRGVPCRRARLARRGGRGSPMGIPFLRLLLVSKAGEVVEVIVVAHDSPPCAWAKPLRASRECAHHARVEGASRWNRSVEGTSPNNALKLTRSAPVTRTAALAA